MGTESLLFSSKMIEKIGFEVTYPAFKNALRPDIVFGPHSFLNSIISAEHGQNCKMSVPI